MEVILVKCKQNESAQDGGWILGTITYWPENSRAAATAWRSSGCSSMITSSREGSQRSRPICSPPREHT